MNIFEWIEPVIAWTEIPAIRFIIIVAISFLFAAVIQIFSSRILMMFAKKSETNMDDQLIACFKFPIFTSILLAGIAYACFEIEISDGARFVIFGILKTAAVIVWGRAAIKFGSLILNLLGKLSGKVSIIQPTTIPLFDMLIKIIIVAGVSYFSLISWDIDVTGWIASAGILGIAIGFAAKDTIANLFAGIFILTDTPYKIGDFILLNQNLRGKVTQIGIRSTRILTRDDIEITIPNATIANSQIVNESAGPHRNLRLRATVEVAYGSDIDKVKEVLFECTKEIKYTSKNLRKSVRFREFGTSGLVFQVRIFIDDPVNKGRVTDMLNTRIYKGLYAAGIEIPYSKHDVFIKEMPDKK